MSGWPRTLGGVRRLATCASAGLRVTEYETVQVTEQVTEQPGRVFELVVVGEVHAEEIARNRLPGPTDDWSGPSWGMAPHFEDLWATLMAEPVSEPVEPVSEPVSDEGEPVSRDERVLSLVRRSPGLRVPALVKATGYPPATVKRAVLALRHAGLVEFRGAPKTGGYWALGTLDDPGDPGVHE